MTAMVAVGLLPRTAPASRAAQQGANTLVTARTDLGHARLSFTERSPGDLDVGGFVLDTHLRACLNQQCDKPWWDAADVLFGSALGAAEHASDRLAAHPGCAVCCCRYPNGRIVLALRLRDGPIVVSGLIEGRASTAWCATAASAMHAWITAGLDPHSLRSLVAADGSGVRFSSGFQLRG